MRLLTFTAGKAKEMIKHFIHEEHNCYTKAMQALEKEYGNEDILTESYLKELRDWPVSNLVMLTSSRNCTGSY